MLTIVDIYELLPQDVIDFQNLNALPENSQGPQVQIMSDENGNLKSSVKMDLKGIPDDLIPIGFTFSDVKVQNLWVVSKPIQLDSQGIITGLYVECLSDGPITADSGTLTNILTSPTNIISINNTYDAIFSGEKFDQCVDKSYIDDPKYKAWADAMESNQPISTREIITICRTD